MKPRDFLTLLAAFCVLFAAAPAASQDAAGVEKLTGTLKKVRDTGVITLGYRDASVPFSYLTASRQPIGYSIALCNAIVDAVKEEVGREVQVKYFPVNPQTRIELVANGTVDLECGSTTNNVERQKQVAFSPVIFVAGTKLMVKRNSKFKSYKDLAGHSIVVTEGTTNEAAIKTLNQKEGLRIRLIQVRDHDQAFELFQRSGADAWANDDVLLYGYQVQAKNPNEFQVLPEYLSYDPYGIMFRRNDPMLAELVRRVFEDLAESRELEQIYVQWFLRNLPSGKNMGMAMSPQLRSIFESLGLPPE
jgi:glutamate/aspartate transport system substrate-binding protein